MELFWTLWVNPRLSKSPKNAQDSQCFSGLCGLALLSHKVHPLSQKVHTLSQKVHTQGSQSRPFLCPGTSHLAPNCLIWKPRPPHLNPNCLLWEGRRHEASAIEVSPQGPPGKLVQQGFPNFPNFPPDPPGPPCVCPIPLCGSVAWAKPIL